MPTQCWHTLIIMMNADVSSMWEKRKVVRYETKLLLIPVYTSTYLTIIILLLQIFIVILQYTN